MSASDAAPLPRLGEVFFDVRGNSRSMRLSWYSDTDVAVFSIWQGGKCTGTFRLPMDDLGRMIEILRRGPDGRSGRAAGERRPSERGPVERGYDGDNTVVHNPGARASADDYPAGPPATGPYGPGDYGSREFRDQAPGEYDSDDYGADDYGPDYGAADHRSADYGRSRTARHRTERYEPADYGRPGYDQATGEWWQEDDHYEADRTGQRYGPADDSGYGQQRFVPPYVRSAPDSSEHGFIDDPEYRLPADPAGRSRHSAGRHSGGRGH